MLNAFQKKVAGWAVACVSVASIGAFAVLAFLVLAAFLNKFSAVVWPLALAAILSILLRPAVNLVERRLKMPPVWAVTVLYFAVAAAALALLAFAIPILIEETVQLARAVPDGLANAAAFLGERFPNAKDEIQARLAELKSSAVGAMSVDSIAKSVAGLFRTAVSATGGAAHYFAFAAAFAVVPIYLFYMLSTNFDPYSFIRRNIRWCGDETREDIVFFARRFAEIMTVFFRGQLTIALIMGALYGTGLAFAGVRFGFLIGFAAGLLNLIPYLGTIIGLGVIIPVSALQDGGGIWLVFASLCVFGAVQLLEGYVLTPKIMGDRTGLHPTVIIFSVFFWGVALDGIIGMVLAIPLTAFFVLLWKGRKAVLRQERAAASAPASTGPDSEDGGKKPSG
ncbi:MAG: AI-2E family transporter [Verrucomicrobia bacterium]|nr:MAG: AI-2E family transporter [Verrucomicrobiota bacterium]